MATMADDRVSPVYHRLDINDRNFENAACALFVIVALRVLPHHIIKFM